MSLVALSMSLCMLGADTVDQAALAKLQGVWVQVSRDTADGKLIGKQLLVKEMEIKDDQWIVTFSDGGTAQHTIIHLDPDADPARLLMRVGNTRYQSIYKLDGDTLMTSVGDEWTVPPEDFKANQKGSGGVVLWIRKKK